MIKRLGVSAVLATLILGLFAVGGGGSALASPTTYYVNASTGNANNDCLSAAAPCLTIQSAIDKAASGDTIMVAAGTYTENVSIAKSLTLDGAQAGVDARTRSTTSESTVDGNGGANFTISADNVTIDGFTLLGPSNQGSAALVLQSGHSGETVQNTIIENPGRAASIQTGDTTFRQNHVQGVGTPGDGFQENSVDVSNLTFADNLFDGAASSNADITIIGSPAPSGTEHSTGIVVSGNQAINDATLIATFHTDGAQITGNTISGAQGSAIYIGGDCSNILVSDNSVSDGVGKAVNVANDFGDGPNSSVTITGNTLQGNAYGVYVEAGAISDTIEAHSNSIVGNTTDGIANNSDQVVDATNNWWSSASGPTYDNPNLPDACGLDMNNPDGQGDAITPCVKFAPWLGLAPSEQVSSWSDGTNAFFVNPQTRQFTFVYETSSGSAATCSGDTAATYPLRGGTDVIIFASCAENSSVFITANGTETGQMFVTLTTVSGRYPWQWKTSYYSLNPPA